MAYESFYTMFLALLRDIFDMEVQQIEVLPLLIKSSSHPKLKESFELHLEESKNQLERLKAIYKTLNENPAGPKSKPIQDLIQETQQLLSQELSPPVKDAYLIITWQKIEHYEIASYGSARAIARHLNNVSLKKRVDFDDIADTLQQSLDEEGDMDEKLTEVAEGGFFTSGINDEAEKTEQENIKT